MQLTSGVRSQRLNYAVDTGTPDNLIVSYDPPITAADYRAGLVLHVRVRNTNTGISRINAGGGNVPIRKMNGANVRPGELPINCIATLIHDGTAFQLSNYGGTGGDVTYEGVNIPFEVDQSPVAGEIVVDFTPPITSMAAGDIIAVQIRNTNPGATVMFINDPAKANPYSLLPNGTPPGGFMLQGDVVAGDVVQFFFDGNDLRFPPNPEMNAPVEYSVGAGQQFATIDIAMEALKRKIIGANGYVTLRMIAGAGPLPAGPGTRPAGRYQGPISISHPSGDRIAIRGQMLPGAVPPTRGELQAVNNSAPQRANDAVFNLAVFIARYGTVVDLQNNQSGVQGRGFINAGPGNVTFSDFLILGDGVPTINGWWWQVGVDVSPGFSCSCQNIAVHGAQVGFVNAGTMNCNSCYAVAGSYIGHYVASGYLGLLNSRVLGNNDVGLFINFGNVVGLDNNIETNGQMGCYANNTSGFQSWWTVAINNGVAPSRYDYQSNVTSSTIIVTLPAADGGGLGATWGPVDPPLNTIGNLGSVVTVSEARRPPISPLAASLSQATHADVEHAARAEARRLMALPTNVLALPLAQVLFEVSNNEDWIDSLVFMVSDIGSALGATRLARHHVRDASQAPARSARNRARRFHPRPDLVHRLAARRGLSLVLRAARDDANALGRRLCRRHRRLGRVF